METYPVPEGSLREVLLNAVIHRDYAVGAPIQIRVYGNRVQIFSGKTTQEQIVTLLREEPNITRMALADRIGITPDGIKYHFVRLREAGRIRHVGPTKKGRWEILGDDDE